jgi:hypothetical protein
MKRFFVKNAIIQDIMKQVFVLTASVIAPPPSSYDLDSAHTVEHTSPAQIEAKQNPGPVLLTHDSPEFEQ